jgi:hypothetical protein
MYSCIWDTHRGMFRRQPDSIPITLTSGT